MSSRKPGPGKHSFTRKQLGVAMLEVLGSVGIGAVVLGGITDQTNRYMDSTKASAAGEYHRIASEAAAQYLASTTEDLTSVKKISWTSVTANVQQVAAFSDTNSYNEKFCFLAKKNANGQKQGILIATKSTTPTGNDNWRRSMMVNSGNVAMGRMTTATSASRGSTWGMDLASWNVTTNCGADQKDAVVTNLEMLQLASNDLDGVLHRNPESDSRLNQMNTAIDMNHYDINNAGTVYTKDVSASGNVTATGNVTAAKFVTTGNEGWYSNTHGGGWYMSDSTWIRAYNNKSVYTGGVVRADSGFQVDGFTVIDGVRNASFNNATLAGALNFGTDTRQMINLWGTAHGIGVQDWTTYFRSGGDFQFYKGGSHNDAQGNAGGGTALMTIKSSGNVGIGTTNPDTKLHVEGNQTIRGGAPTIFLRDTDDRSGMIHVNSNLMYFLRGCGNDSGLWCEYDGAWPLTLNLENNAANFGGSILVKGAEVINSFRDGFFRFLQAVNLTFTNTGDNYIWMQGTNGNNRIVGLEKIYSRNGAEVVQIAANGSVVTVNTTLKANADITAVGAITGSTLEATKQVGVGNACSDKGLIAATAAGVPVYCNGTKWSNYAGLEINRYYADSPGPEEPATAKCAAGEVALAGGGYCATKDYPKKADGVWQYMHYSMGGTSNWSVDCYDRRNGLKASAIAIDGETRAEPAYAHAYVVCVKASESLTLK